MLLVIALDEGVMPQTVEHFEILKMLHIRQGIIVFTKADLVDEDWAEMVEEDVSALVEGSFLETLTGSVFLPSLARTSTY